MPHFEVCGEIRFNRLRRVRKQLRAFGFQGAGAQRPVAGWIRV